MYSFKVWVGREVSESTPLMLEARVGLCLLEGWRKTVVSEVDGGRHVHYGAKLLRDIGGR